MCQVPGSSTKETEDTSSPAFTCMYSREISVQFATASETRHRAVYQEMIKREQQKEAEDYPRTNSENTW